MKIREREKLVYEKFPISKAEKTCDTEKREMDKLRNAYRKKLMEQGKEKREM